MSESQLREIIFQARRDKAKRLHLSVCQLSSLPAEIGQLTNLKELYLGSNQLKSLPAEIGQLSNLSLLDLSGNWLTSLPQEICQLSNLTRLNLRGNQLKSLPTEICQLSNLTRLNLHGNQLKSLPAEIGQLSNLTGFDLQDNQLLSLPQEIGQLSSLVELNLHGNQLNSLPAEIGQLSNLTWFDLQDNQLLSLPPEIGQLSNLTMIGLNYNQLKSVPPEIGQLTSLKNLNLGANQLKSVPPEIGQLTSLITLELWINQLESLPAEIGQLSNLRNFNANSNQLSTLPAKIGRLSNLIRLYLQDNPLKSLPAEICQLTSLKNLELGVSHIETPPIEIAVKGLESIKGYFRQLIASEKDYIYEAKLLIVGEAGAGKTTLANKIIDQSYELKDEISTKGIDVIRWKFPIDNGRNFQLNIWDFGGQEIYHTTHQFFLTKRSLYVLVADTRKEDTDFHYWCSIVALLSENSPLLVVKNEKQNRRREINEPLLRGQFTNFKEAFASNLATNRGLTEIVNNIKHYIKELPHIGNALPKTWVNVKEILEQNRHRNYISLEEYLNICEDSGFKRRKDKLQLSEYLHDLGICLHFQQDPVLKNIVIINPEWGTDAVYKVLDNDGVISSLGKFTKSNLKNIWKDDKYATMHDELLQLMVKFQLCYKIPGTSDNYIAPQLLTEDQPYYDWNKANNLILRYEYEFMPKGIITRFIVVMHSLIADQNKVWKSGVILKKEDTWAEIIEYYGKREINIRINGKSKRDLLVIVTHELDKINGSFHRLKFNKMIPCICAECITDRKPHFYEYKDLKRRIQKERREVECGKSYAMVNVRSLIEGVFNAEILGLSMPEIKLKRDRHYAEKAKRNKVFVSYSHKDKDMLERIQVHLKVLESEGVSVNLWDDTQIKAGMKWRDEIEKALSEAKVAILLISTEFLASDFVRTYELPHMLKAAENDGATILPLILKPCRFSKNKRLSVFQAVNNPAEPLSKLPDDKQDEVLLKLADRIADLTQEMV